MTKRLLQLGMLYGVLLAASQVTRRCRNDEGSLSPGLQTLHVQETDHSGKTGHLSRFVYRDWNEAGPDSPVVVLLHGSPGSSGMFKPLAASLKDSFRLIIPDLPGFGESTHRLADYSTHAHALAMLESMDQLGIERAHWLGYSMGGGVALDAYAIAPERFQSLTLLSSIGVQELELLGDYTLNHAVHGLQLGALWLLAEGTPHFGLLDQALLNHSYARNFFDTDQRPFRETLQKLTVPTLILHGEKDRLVPFAAACEHHRLVPQSRLKSYPEDGHMIVFTKPEALAKEIIPFIREAESGAAPKVSAEQMALAREPYSMHQPKRDSLGTVLFLMLLLALATLVTEDFTCIGAGLLVARGAMAFLPATFACFLGIFIGDLLLYLSGRWLGRPALARAPLKWFLKPSRVEASATFFKEKGPMIVFTSRFVPGSRLPTYFGAGMFRAPFWTFTGWFALAAAVWTPILVALSYWLGGSLLALFAKYERYVFLSVIGVILFLWAVIKVLLPASSHRGRRLLISAWRRRSRWEFWPMWLFYPPVLLYIVYLGLRQRGLTLFTAANPGIPSGGGVVLESKRTILDAFGGHPAIATYTVILPDQKDPDPIESLHRFMHRSALSYPVVLKPDIGERGLGVKIVRSDDDARAYFETAREPIIAQEYIPGREFGIFYYRYPNEDVGKILSITDKRLISVEGDGIKTLEQLILEDDRALCMAPYFFNQLGAQIARVPDVRENVPLTEVGTHCRGALFLDGSAHITEALTQAIDKVSRSFSGFYFGRYDLRVPTVEALERGEEFRILELNGVTSESTNIYDPTHSLWHAYKTLWRQWRIAFEIGAQNRCRGVTPWSIRELLKLYLQYKER